MQAAMRNVFRKRHIRTSDQQVGRHVHVITHASFVPMRLQLHADVGVMTHLHYAFKRSFCTRLHGINDMTHVNYLSF